MKDRKMNRWSTYEPFYVELSNRKVADIIVTHHARTRWLERVDKEKISIEDICAFLWDKLKKGNVTLYDSHAGEVFMIDEDLLMVVEFAELKYATDLAGDSVYQMIVVTFLGRMTEAIELRDLKTYYAWLRHSRRTVLMKNGRKRK